MSDDSASAYEKHARAFLSARDGSTVGAEVVRRWARSLAPGTEVLEIGCGGGVPVTRVLAVAGLKIWAVDSSPTLLSEFRARFPDIPVECARALESSYFGRKFGAVISVGLIFHLNAEEQAALIHRVSELIVAGGRLLFTAPVETGTWADTTTGHECRSLGRERYESILTDAGFRVVATYEDEGRNNYYEAKRVLASADANRPRARVSIDAMRIALTICFLVLLAACGEYKEVSYSDFAAAKADGAMARGWIPVWIPRSAVQIQEAHDLDTNRSALALRFSEKEVWTPPPTCKQISQADVPNSPVQPSGWPDDIPASSLVTHRHVYYACEENSFVAVSQSQGEFFHWRPHGS